MNFFKKLISEFEEQSKTKETKIYIPNIALQVTEKRLINLLDRISNKTTDFIGLIKNFHKLPMGYKMKIPNFGNIHDCYRMEQFSQTALNQLIVFIENTIQREYQTRLACIEAEAEYMQLTSLDLTHDLKIKFEEFNKIKQDAILGKSRNNAENDILSGLQTEKLLLTDENALYGLRQTKEQNAKEHTRLVNEDYKMTAQKIVREFAVKKTEENPQLGEIYQETLNRQLSDINNKNGINGDNRTNGKGSIKDMTIVKNAPVPDLSESKNGDINFDTQNQKTKIDYDRF